MRDDLTAPAPTEEELRALSDDALRQRMADLAEVLRGIRAQLRDDHDGTFVRGDAWRAKARWKRDRLREVYRALEAEKERRHAPKREARQIARATAARAQAEAARAKRLASEGARFQAAARARLPADVYEAILAAALGTPTAEATAGERSNA